MLQTYLTHRSNWSGLINMRPDESTFQMYTSHTSGVQLFQTQMMSKDHLCELTGELNWFIFSHCRWRGRLSRKSLLGWLVRVFIILCFRFYVIHFKWYVGVAFRNCLLSWLLRVFIKLFFRFVDSYFRWCQGVFFENCKNITFKSLDVNGILLLMNIELMQNCAESNL